LDGQRPIAGSGVKGIDQLRILRKEYPDLWKLLMKWDRDSPVSFHADGHTVHDFDLRFQAEDLDLVPKDRKFRWKMLTGDTMVSRRRAAGKQRAKMNEYISSHKFLKKFQEV
jgi:hypothetical protein